MTGANENAGEPEGASCDSILKFSQLLVSNQLYKKIQQRTTHSTHWQGAYRDTNTLTV